ncbi:hypothetical protein [Guptibacillus spartinae]|nr:hypothetical protein [Pseudalkalibacillus spartinae]
MKSKDEMCKELSQIYNMDIQELMMHNDRQIHMLYTSCKDEKSGELSRIT